MPSTSNSQSSLKTQCAQLQQDNDAKARQINALTTHHHLMTHRLAAVEHRAATLQHRLEAVQHRLTVLLDVARGLCPHS